MNTISLRLPTIRATAITIVTDCLTLTHLCLVEITNLERILLGIGPGGSEHEPSALDNLGRKGA